MFAIKGALPIQSEQMLAPTPRLRPADPRHRRTATKEIVDDSDGAVVAGDEVGLSGLQKRYDSTLRGTPGVSGRAAAADLRFLVGVAVTVRTLSDLRLRRESERQRQPGRPGHGLRGQARSPARICG